MLVEQKVLQREEPSRKDQGRTGQSTRAHLQDGWPGSHSASYQCSDGFCCPKISPTEGLMTVNQLFRNLSSVRGENIPSLTGWHSETGQEEKTFNTQAWINSSQVWVWAGGGVRTLARREECWPVNLLSHKSRKSEILNQLSFQKLHILNSFYSNK